VFKKKKLAIVSDDSEEENSKSIAESSLKTPSRRHSRKNSISQEKIQE
jgi:hypothetical protein